MAKPVAERSKENVVAALDAADTGLQAVAKGLAAGQRRIHELEEALEESQNARAAAETRAASLEEKLKRVQMTLT